jgi:hypothetical protein
VANTVEKTSFNQSEPRTATGRWTSGQSSQQQSKKPATKPKSPAKKPAVKKPDAHQLHEQHLQEEQQKAKQIAAWRAQASSDRAQAAQISTQISSLERQVSALNATASTSSTAASTAAQQAAATTASGSATAASAATTAASTAASTTSTAASTSATQITALDGQISTLEQQRSALLSDASAMDAKITAATAKNARPKRGDAVAADVTKAATLTRNGELTYLSFPIEKTETDPATGDVYVYGKATDGSLDSDEQIIDPVFAAKAVQDWLHDGANIRVQHNPQRDPAGVGVEADTDGTGATWVKGRIVEPIAQKLVHAGALRAYSVGIARPTIVRDASARGGRITDGQVVEISLVDRPANKNCSIQLVKAAKDGHPKRSGKVTGDRAFIEKMAGIAAFTGNVTKGAGMTALAEETVSVTLPADVSVAFTPADLAKVLALRKSKDVNVGEDKTPGGVDRGKMPDEDFAGANRSFPIHSPGDVADAAQSIGRAGDDNYSSDKLKANIKSIAHRKGPEYVAQLPDSWKDDDDTVDKNDDGTVVEKAEACTLCHGSGKIREGHMTCPRCHGDGKMAASEPDEHGDTQDDGDDSDDDDSAEKARRPRLKKGKKSKDASSDDDDSDEDFSDDDDSSADDSNDDSGGDDSDDNDDNSDDSDDDDSDSDDSDDSDDDDGDDGKKKSRGKPAVTKGGSMCTKCGGAMKAKHKFCPSCGAALDGGSTVGDGDDDGDVPAKTGSKKSVSAKLKKNAKPRLKKDVSHAVGSPSPGDGVKGEDTKPMAQHREPDGSMVEAYENDSGMQEGDQGSAPAQPTRLEQPMLKADAAIRTMRRLAKSSATVNLGALHDLTCPAFHPATIAKCYPDRSLATEVNVEEFQAKSLNLVASLPYHEAARASLLGAFASTLKSADSSTVWEARDELHKAFSDANPGPGTAPTPASDITPGSYNRPYLSAGHAAPSPQHGSPNTTPVVSGSINAEQFSRGPLLTGHEAPSPGTAPAVSQAVAQAITGVAMTNDLVAGIRAASGSSVPGSLAPPIMPMGLQTGLGGVPNVTAVKGRTFYSHASKDQVKAAMQGIHDHISSVFPDICPMKHDGDDNAPAAAKAAVPGTVIPRQLTKAAQPVVAKSAITKKDLKRQRKIDQLEKRLVEEAAFALAAVPQPDVTKAVTTEEITKADTVTLDVISAALERLTAQLAERDQLLVKQQKVLKKQQKTIDELASQPDPNVNAFRGGMMTAPAFLQKSVSPVTSVPDMADVQNRTKAMMLGELEAQFRSSPDPAQREAAWKSILSMRGLGN